MVRVKTKGLTKILAHIYFQERLRNEVEEGVESRKFKEVGRKLDADSEEKWKGPAKMILSKSMEGSGMNRTGGQQIQKA